MPTETLHIQNFAGIQDAEISLSRFNLFIGPQASGKSVTAKLFYYFKRIIGNIKNANIASIYNLDRTISRATIFTAYHDEFLKYFPATAWGDDRFEICYKCGDLSICLSRPEPDARYFNFSFSPYFVDLLEMGRQFMHERQKPALEIDIDELTNQYQQTIKQKLLTELSPSLENPNVFIPAGRSFFSSIQRNVFLLWGDDIKIDPFLAQFGNLYDGLRYGYDSMISNERIAALYFYVSKIIRGKYVRENDLDYILTPDQRHIPISLCSSGQQEALPLAMFLVAAVAGSYTLFIEEPEAHLFPSTQRDVIHLLATADERSETTSEDNCGQYVITTHSPYILSALNNLMYAGQIAEKCPDRKEQVAQVIDEAAPIAPGQVQAYLMQDGTAQSIIDPETGLIRATMLDEVSGELAQEFERLMDIEFKEE